MAPRKRNETARPFLKWAGGKTQLLAQFEALYPQRSQVVRYLEPFVGSAAVFFQIRRFFEPEAIILADFNAELINAYRAIQQDVEKVIRLLARYKKAHGEEHYYRLRALQPEGRTPAESAARMIYLNKTCFNGLYRVNARGGFNVPIGRYDDPPILDASNLRAVSRTLQGVELRESHFRDTLKYARSGDFIYFDPPYQPLSTTALFTSYTRNSFGMKDQEELAAVFRQLSERGCRVMLSNSDTPLIRRLYRGFDLHTVDARRSINSNGKRRGTIPEIVVLNYVPSESSALDIPLRTRSADPGALKSGKQSRRAVKQRRAPTAARP
jgi:DNA adenine methylase